MSGITIPLGIKSAEGVTIQFNIATSSLPSTIQVYLDDVVANTSTLLNTTQYAVTPSTQLNGTGRFFLRLQDSSLDLASPNLDNLSVYLDKRAKAIVINGQLPKGTRIAVYDVQGRQVIVRHPLKTNTTRETIAVYDLNSGVYIVQIQNSKGISSKKLILD